MNSKERVGEELPKDIEAARAWWKANESRFAAKETAAPKSQDTPSKAVKKDSPADSQDKAVSSQTTDSQPAPEVSPRTIRWPIPVAIVSVLLAAVAWFSRRKR